MMTEEEKIQVQDSLDSWYINCMFSHDLIKETNKSCSNLWDLALDIIEDHEMPHVQFLGQSIPLSNCLADVNQQKISRADGITQLNFWNMEVVKEFITKPTKCL
jgi:hypothetical protein